VRKYGDAAAYIGFDITNNGCALGKIISVQRKSDIYQNELHFKIEVVKGGEDIADKFVHIRCKAVMSTAKGNPFKVRSMCIIN
jgi:hypothetical protein